MIKKIIFFLFVISTTYSAVSQPPTTDPNKILAEAQRKLDSVMKNNPAIKKYSDKSNPNNVINMPKLPTNMPDIGAYSSKPDTAFLSHLQVPVRNDKALVSLPTHTLNQKELISFISGLRSVISPLLQNPGSSSSSLSAYSPHGLGNASALAWYMGNGDAGLQMALDAATRDPNDLNVLNNLSSLLFFCGLPYKSVSILEYVHQQDPGNTTVDNNLGQAYIQMGETRKGEEYLKQAVAAAPYHPNANFSLACLSYIKGDKNGAARYCENSLRGSFIPDAWTMLKAIHPDVKLMDYVRHRYKQPDFFNPHKYPLPPTCHNSRDRQSALIQVTEFKNMIESVKESYNSKLKQEAEYIKQHMAADLMQKVRNQQSPFRPFGAFAIIVLGDIEKSYGETWLKLAKYDTIYFQRMQDFRNMFAERRKPIDEQFKKRSDAAGEGNPDPNLEYEYCKAVNQLADTYLQQMADLTEQRQQEWLTQTKDYFNDYAFWCYVASTDDHSYYRMFDQLVIDYLTMEYGLASTEQLGCDAKYTYTHDESAAMAFEEGRCPFSAKIDVEVKEVNEEGKEETKTPASFDIDCEKFGATFKMKNGISFNLKHRNGGSTTLSFVGKLGIGEILGGSMQSYITFGGNEPFDVGFKWDYDMNLPDVLGGKNSAGWSVSMNNAVDFHGKGKVVEAMSSWAYKNVFHLDPPAPQLNRNVRLYSQ